MASGVRDDFTDRGSAFLLLTALAVSAFAATTFEIGWARLLAMVMGSSVYAYGTLVVVVLAGQGIGSVLYGRAQRTIEGHRRRFALLEFVIAFTVGSLDDCHAANPDPIPAFLPSVSGCVWAANRRALRSGSAGGVGSVAARRRDISGSGGQPRRH